MQTHGGAEAEAAITAAERHLRIEIKVDWNKNGTYSHFLSDLSSFSDDVVVTRALSGAAPQEIMLIEGAAAAELTFTASGEISTGSYAGSNFVSLFSPYNGASPLYNLNPIGCEVTYRIGVETVVGIVWYQQFVGNIRTITPDRGTNKVSFACLDRVEKLRRPVAMTDWAILDRQANQGRILGQLMYSHWVIDHCLKQCDTSSSPWRWPQIEELGAGSVQIYLSGNGGIAPNVGWVDGSSQNQFTEDENPVFTTYHDRGEPHPDSPTPTIRPMIFRAQRDWGSAFNIYWAADRRVVTGAGSHVIGFTLHTANYAGSQWFTTMAEEPIMSWVPKDNRTMHVMVGLGKMWIRYVDIVNGLTFNGTKIDIPTTGDYVRCVAQIAMYTNDRCRLAVGNTATTWQTMQVGRGFSMSTSTGRLQLSRELSIQDICVGVHSAGEINAPGEAGKTATYVGVLDKGLNRLSFLPKRWGSLAWDVISEVAAAEFGAVFWDEDGVFQFWNQDTILAKKDEFARSLTLDQVSGLQITNSVDSIRNIYSVTAKKTRVQDSVVFETQGPDEIYVPGLTEKEIQIWVDEVVTPNSAMMPVYKSTAASPGTRPVWSDQVQFGAIPQELTGGTWIEQNSNTTPWDMTMFRAADGSTILRVWNGYSVPVRFSNSSGGAAFRWNGSKLVNFADQTFTVRDQASILKWGPQGLPLNGDWYQEFYDVDGVFSKFLARTSDPIPTTQSVIIAGDPRLQLGDAIKIQDPDGFGEEMRLQIYGITRKFSRDAGLVDELTVELTAPPKIGFWDSPQYGIWDTSFIWSD